MKNNSHSNILADARRIINDDTPFAVKEAYRTLYTNLMYLPMESSCKKIVFTSAYPGEGKTSVSINIAYTIANTSPEARVLLIDADMRSPRVAQLLGIDTEEAKKRAEAAVADGSAYDKFVEWIGAQGGDTSYALNPELFPKTEYVYEIKAPRDAFIVHTDAEKIGLASVALGAGRATKDSAIDYAAGIILEKKAGDEVKCGDVIARLYANDEGFFAEAERIFVSGLVYGDERPAGARLIHGIIR